MEQKRDQFNWVFKRALLFFLLFFISVQADAQLPQQSGTSSMAVFVDESEPVDVLNFEAQVPLIFEIPEGVHLFKRSIRLELNSAKAQAYLDLPMAGIILDELTGEDVEVYRGQVSVVARITFDRAYDFLQPLTGLVVYQGCVQKICQREQELPFSLKLAPDQTTLAGVQTARADWHSFFKWIKKIDISEILSRGLWFALFIAFVAGLLTSLTPCVLPIIPLTLAFIGVTPFEKKSTRLSHTAIFTLGMIVMYATLGVLSALLGQSLGIAYTSPLFLLLLVIFFVFMALWMFGVFQWPIFSKIQTAVIRHEPLGRFRYLYAGLTVGFLAAPCVGPVVAPLLVYIATTRDVLTGFVLMLAYALGLSLLFFILGFFSNQWITKLGRHTRWVKNILGTLLIIVALFYLQILFKPLMNIHIPYDSYFDYDFRHAQTIAREENKGLVVDFYADWCVGCHEIEQFIWSHAPVRAAVTQHFIPVKINCTTQNAQCNSLSDEYGLSGFPVILFLDPQGREIPHSRLVGSEYDVSEFMDHLRHQEARLEQ